MAALTSWTSLVTATKGKVQNVLLFMKGMGTNEIFAVEVDQTTGAIPVEGVAGGVPIPIAGTFTPLPTTGRVVAQLAHLSYVSSPVSSAAYTTLVASTAATINELFVAETSGTYQILAVGAPGSEVPTIYMGPGGNTYDVAIPAGSRISLKNNDSVTTTSSTGQISISGYT